MEDIGHKLREARERLGLTLSEVERITRIRVHYLEMLEKGDIESMPSIVQARGFLNNYAEFLGLNTAAVLDDFALHLQSNHKRLKTKSAPLAAPKPAPVRVRSSRPRWLSTDLLIAVFGSVGVVAVLIWGGGRVLAGMRQETESPEDPAAAVAATVTASIPGLTQPALPTAGEEATFSFTPGPTATAPDFIVGPSNLVDIRLVGEMRAWVRVTVDGQERYNGRVTPGEILEFQGEQVVEVTTGNGAGVRVYYNGQDQGLLGGYSQVVIRLWTLDGAMTPTPTLQLTPTPTQTPQPSETPTQEAGP